MPERWRLPLVDLRVSDIFDRALAAGVKDHAGWSPDVTLQRHQASFAADHHYWCDHGRCFCLLEIDA